MKTKQLHPIQEVNMEVWVVGRKAKNAHGRTENQKGWDSAILTAAEYVRRRMNYNEKLALEEINNE